MPNSDAGTFLRLRGVNPLKSMRRWMDDVNFRHSKKDGEYRVFPRTKEERVDRLRHIKQAANTISNYGRANKPDEEGQEKECVSYSDFVPGGFDDLPPEVQHGYYMDPGITDRVVRECAPGLAGILEKTEDQEKFCRDAVRHFRCLLRGDGFDLSLAVAGANMLLTCEGKANENKETFLDDGLFHLAERLSKAGERISIGSPRHRAPEDGSVSGTVIHVNRREVGDVMVKKNGKNSFAFHTKAISRNRTRFGIIKKGTRGINTTRAKLRAAYQSVFHAVTEKRDDNDVMPDSVILTPLFGSSKDGSKIVRRRNKNGEMETKDKYRTIDTTLGGAARILTINPNIKKIDFEAGSNYKAFRNGCRERLGQIFPQAPRKRAENDIVLDVSGSEVDAPADVDRARRSGHENVGSHVPSPKLVSSSRSESSVPYERSDRSAASSVAESNAEESGSESALPDTDAASSSVEDGYFGSRGNRVEYFEKKGWRTDFGNPDYKQEWEGITLPEGSSEMHSSENNTGSPGRSSMSENDDVASSTGTIEKAIVVKYKGAIGESKGFNSEVREPAPGSITMEANTAGPRGDGFKEKRTKDVKSEGVRLAKGNIRRSLGTAPRVVFDTYAFSTNGNRPLKLQEIRNQLKVAVDPLRKSYLMDSGLEVIHAYQLGDHISGLDLQIKSILFEISKAKSTLGYGNEGKLETMADSLQKCGAILKQTQRMLDSATSEDRRNQVKKALQRVVKVMDIISRSPKAKAVEKERVRQRPEKNVVSRSTGKEVGSDRSRAEMIETKASEAVINVLEYWQSSSHIKKDEGLKGLEDILSISAGAKDNARLAELEKNHDRLQGLYLAIKRMDDEDGLVRLYRNAMSVLKNMQHSSSTHQ